MNNQEREQAAQKLLDEITETIKELRAYGSDEARAKRAIAHQQYILEGISRKRDPIPWAISQFRLATALAVIAGKASDIPKLRKAAFRLEKVRRVFEHVGYQDAVLKCEALQADIKKLLTKLGDEGGPFNPNRASLSRGGLEPEGQEYADDLADRLRQTAGNIDRAAARRSAEALRKAREFEELDIKRALAERTQARQREKTIQRGMNRGFDR